MTTDPYDPFPSGIREAEMGELHLQYVDRLLAMIIGDDAVAKVNTVLAEALDLAEPIAVTKEDGTFNAAVFIQVAEVKLKLLQRAVHETAARYVVNPWPMKRRSANDGGPNTAMLDEVRKLLKAYNFTLTEVRSRHPEADPASHRYGIAGRPPAFGVHESFEDLGGMLRDFEG